MFFLFFILSSNMIKNDVWACSGAVLELFWGCDSNIIYNRREKHVKGVIPVENPLFAWIPSILLEFQAFSAKSVDFRKFCETFF